MVNGNLVLYKKGQYNQNYIVWQTGTSDGVNLDLQDDGNLCLKDGDDNVVWSSDMYMDAEKVDPSLLTCVVSNMGTLGVYLNGQCFWVGQNHMKAPKKKYKV